MILYNKIIDYFFLRIVCDFLLCMQLKPIYVVLKKIRRHKFGL